MLTKTKLLMSATLLAIAAPLSSVAQDAETGMSSSGRVTAENIDNLIRTSNIIGGSVYTMNDDADMDMWDETEAFDAVDNGWNEIGDIDDIVLSRDGTITGVVVEGGGFLGIGDDTVVLDLSDLRLIDDGTDDYAWVTRISEDEFEAMPEIEENWF